MVWRERKGASISEQAAWNWHIVKQKHNELSKDSYVTEI